MRRSPDMMQRLAAISALHTLQRRGRVLVADVSFEQGLCEFSAYRALRDLVREGRATRAGRWFVYKKLARA
jgi:hypothetical protein